MKVDSVHICCVSHKNIQHYNYSLEFSSLRPELKLHEFEYCHHAIHPYPHGKFMRHIELQTRNIIMTNSWGVSECFYAFYTEKYFQSPFG